jgi:uncharacterized YigZ family protein
MELPLQIKTISAPSEFRLKEKGSLFISKALYAENEEAALSLLKSEKKESYNATHHCYTYKFQDGKFKYSDDGEPNGTAGLRIYNAINHFGLTNLILIVMRYFGGTKLGVGPLGKTYYDSAFKALENAKIETKTLYEKGIIEFGFDFSNLVHRLIAKFSVIIESTNYDRLPQIGCFVKAAEIDKFEKEILEISLNQVVFQRCHETKYL